MRTRSTTQGAVVGMGEASSKIVAIHAKNSTR